MKSTYINLVKHFGTQTQASECLKVHQTTVSDWVTGRHGMSAAVALRAEKLTGGKFTAAQLCPSVFGEAAIQHEAASQ